MSAASISQFEWRLVNQQRQIYDCVFRLFDSSKYLTTLRSNISRCQKATTLILITLYNPLFHLWKSSKKSLGAIVFFVLDPFFKSVTVTSFSQLHLSRNCCSRRSLDQINLHFFSSSYTMIDQERWKMWKTFDVFLGMENFTFREMQVGEKSKRKFVAFLSPIVYYLGDLLKDLWLLYGTKHSLVYNLIVYHHHCSF